MRPSVRRPTPDPAGADDARTVDVALAANVAVAAAKATAAVVTGSRALLAESLHSLADTGDQIFLRVSLHRANRVADDRHPFGYGKERFFWAFVAAVFMFVSGAVVSVIEGMRTLTSATHHVTAFGVSYTVLVAAAAADAVSFTRAWRRVRRRTAATRGGIRRELRRSRNATVKVVLVEDGAALVGVALAAAGIGLHQLTGDGRWDAAASIAIGVLLAYTAYTLARDTKALLLGQSADRDELGELSKVLARRPEIVSIVELLTMYTGPESLLVTARVALRDDLCATQIAALSDEVDAELRAAVPAVDEVFLDVTPGH